MWRDSNLNTAGRVPKRNHIARVQRLARERAEAQARRIPWQRLLHTRNEYIDWQQFYLWIRSILKEDIRGNRDNVAERLGFLGRIIHGENPRAWLKEMRHRLGEKLDFASVLPE